TDARGQGAGCAERRDGLAGGLDRETAGCAHGERGGGGAGELRRLGDGQRERLQRVGPAPVVCRQGQRVGTTGTGGAAERGGPVTVVVETDAPGQRPVRIERRRGVAGGLDREAAGSAHGEGGTGGAGQARRLVDGQHEGLGGVGTATVVSRQGQRVGTTGTGGATER